MNIRLFNCDTFSRGSFLPEINSDFGKLVLRVGVSLLILLHGVDKVGNEPALNFIIEKLNAVSLPDAIAYGVFLGEIIAPALVILGVYTRLFSLIIFFNMVFAVTLVHSEDIFMLTSNGGWGIELQALYLISFLSLFLMGGGKYAIKED